MKNTIKKIATHIQNRIENNVSKVRLYEHLYWSAKESKTLTEFYKKLKEDPEYKLYESDGIIKGVIYKERHVFLFDDYIAKEYKALMWNELSHQAERETKDNELTR
ncbi:hypothetical protein [Tenacibaculum agarivorans]|uniref:hypothetical protein n=1 Tax=Tenacibaculum agarivorans TaxID=1908389 RepID=UPI00094BC2F0|nr:hypothetical protein [Tenacibaculum agarivorans]